MLTAAQLREKYAQGATTSGANQPKPTSETTKKASAMGDLSNPSKAPDTSDVRSQIEVSQSAGDKATTGDKAPSKRPKAAKPTVPKKKSKITATSGDQAVGQVFVPNWEVYEGDTLFGFAAEGRKVDPVELLKGICLPADKKKLSLHKTSDGVRAVAQLLAKV